MAIRPDDALSPDEADQAEIRERETKIDAAIKEAARRSGRIWLASSLFGDNVLVRQALLDRYREAGWDLEMQDDERDGSAYEFRRATDRPSFPSF